MYVLLETLCICDKRHQIKETKIDSVMGTVWILSFSTNRTNVEHTKIGSL